MRTVFVATVGRSDYGLLRPIIDRMSADPRLDYRLVVTGAHLSKLSGGTVAEIEAEQRPIAARIATRETLGDPAAASAAMGEIIASCATLFARERVDLLLVMGDRFEMFAVAAAAVPLNIPIAHVHGGELSLGAIDDVFRHAMTKMAHLHFSSTKEHAARIVRMGEEPWRVTVSGAPGLDNLLGRPLPDREALAARFGISFASPPILVTFHPVTRQFELASEQISELLAALERFDLPIVFTAPNADAGGEVVRLAIESFRRSRPRSWLIENFGSSNYLAMLREAAVMVGNSSSGIIEAPSFHLPTVNIGDRQQGRARAPSVIDVECRRDAIEQGIRRALDPSFRAGLANMLNPYGNGRAAERIIDVLAEVPLDARLVMKGFHDAC